MTKRQFFIYNIKRTVMKVVVFSKAEGMDKGFLSDCKR